MSGMAEQSDNGKAESLDEEEAGTAALAEGTQAPPLEDPNKL